MKADEALTSSAERLIIYCSYVNRDITFVIYKQEYERTVKFKVVFSFLNFLCVLFRYGFCDFVNSTAYTCLINCDSRSNFIHLVKEEVV